MTGTVLLATCLVLGQGAAAADEDLKPAVTRLVRQLDADELARRDAAEAELVRLGPKVLDLLPEVTDRTPAEVRQRLARVRRQLEEALAHAAVEASHVTLKNGAIRLSECLGEIERQTGNRFVDLREQFGQEVTDPTLSVAFDKTPFWTALDDILKQAKLTVYPFGSEGALGLRALISDAESVAPTCTSGPMRFQVLDLTARRSYAEATSSLTLRLGILWEPRLKPISLRQRLASLVVEDDQGRSLVPPEEQGQFEVPVNRESPSVELNLPLVLPPRDARQIVHLGGTLEAVLPGRVETFRFDGLLEAKAVVKQSAGVTVTLAQVRRNGVIWEVWLNVQFDKASGALESYRGWILDNEACLEGPDGKRIENDGLETSMRTETEIGLVYLFDLPEPPAKSTFVYKTPTKIIPAEIKYELKGLKLP